MTFTTKNIVAELNKGENLNGDNSEIWSMKIQNVLEELEEDRLLANKKSVDVYIVGSSS